MDAVKKLIQQSLTVVDQPRDLESWLLSFENACEALNIPENKRRIVCITYFRGYLAVWAKRKQEQHPDCTWVEFKDILQREFIDTNRSTKAQDQLLSTRQRFDESMDAYVRRFRRLLTLSGVNPDEDLVIRTFMNGISNNLTRANVSVLQPETFETAVAHANSCAVALQSSERRNPRRRDISNNQGRRPRFQTQRRSFRPSSEVSNPTKRNKSTDVRCYSCNQRGHFASNCPNKKEVKIHAVNDAGEEELDMDLELAGNDRDW